MEEVYADAIKGLIASGPLALVLAAGTIVLWRRLNGALEELTKVRENQLAWFRDETRKGADS